MGNRQDFKGNFKKNPGNGRRGFSLKKRNVI
jgi:hypothetical protein